MKSFEGSILQIIWKLFDKIFLNIKIEDFRIMYLLNGSFRLLDDLNDQTTKTIVWRFNSLNNLKEFLITLIFT